MKLPARLPALEYEGIGIRRIRRGDARVLRRLLADNRAWLRPWEATHPTLTLQEPGSFPMGPVIQSMLKSYRAGQGIPWVITENGAVVGQLSLASLAGGSLSSAQLGYWVSEHVAGRGITTTAVALATDFCFQDLGLHRVEICIRPENHSSLRIPEKLGFQHEGKRFRYIHIDGAWRDHECFVMFAEDAGPGALVNYLSAQHEGSANRI